MDIDNIPYGTDFREHIRKAILNADVILVIIGPRWRGPRKGGKSRIQEENDPVRIEVESAINESIRIIPILVGTAKMPKQEQLPTTLHKMIFLNAAIIDTGRDFHRDVGRLLTALDQSPSEQVLSQTSVRTAQESAFGRSKGERAPFSWAFIAHEYLDHEFADAVTLGLEQKGFRCWIAPRDMSFGIDWSEAIAQAIRKCTVFILLLSHRTNSSVNILHEVKLAHENKRPIVPVSIDKTMPSGKLRSYLGSVECLNAASGLSGLAFDDLLRSVMAARSFG